MKFTITLSALLALQVLASPLPKSTNERDVDLTAYGAANMRGEVSAKRDEDLTAYGAANMRGEVSEKKRNNLEVYGAAAQKTHTTV